MYDNSNSNNYGRELSEPTVQTVTEAPAQQPAEYSAPYHQGWGAPYPQGGYPSQPFPPAPSRKKAERAPMGSKGIVALCLCCALLGGAVGGFAGGMFEHGPGPVITASGGAVSPAGGGSALTDPIPNVVIPALSSAPTTISVIYEQALPSIVGISVEGVTTNAFGQITPLAATGTGFVIREDGYILTNSHVITDASSITVRLGGQSYEAELVGNDADTEVAVLKIEASGLKPIRFGDSDSLRVGDMVLAIGNPLGEYVNTLTVGYISSLDRLLNIDGNPINMFQTDASINPGNSGGPLFNLAGEVIGVTTAKSSGSGIEGIGFAIPINDAVRTMELIMEYGYAKGRAQLGVSVYGVDEEQSRRTGIPAGVYVSSVTKDSCADKAGVKQGDIITGLGQYKIKTTDELFAARLYFMAGETSTITVLRNSQEMVFTITFDEREREEPVETAPLEQSSPQGGEYVFPFEDYFPFK